MRSFWPIYKRELFAFFITPLAWVLIVAFLVVQGWGVLKRLGAGWARKSFFFSLVYLAVLFAALFMNATAHV